MRKLSEIKGEEALDVLAEIIVPITTIVNDEEVKNGFDTNLAKCVSIAIKKHKAEVMEILTALEGGEPDVNVLTLPVILGEIFSEPAVQSLFQ